MPKRLSEHLATFHKTAAAHHGELAKCFGKLAGFGKAAKSEMKDDEGGGLADCLEKIVAAHVARAEYHKEAMAECEKAIEASDLEKRKRENRVVPSQISAVTPDAPQNVRAVPRTGGKPMPVAIQDISRPNAPLDFQKLVGLEELDNL
jgi:hypothetical protein